MLRTTPVMIEGKEHDAGDEKTGLSPAEDDPADVERDGAADAQAAPRTMKTMDLRRPLEHAHALSIEQDTR